MADVRNIFNLSNSPKPLRKLVLLISAVLFIPAFSFLILKAVGSGRLEIDLGETTNGSVKIIEQSTGKLVLESSTKKGSFNTLLPSGQYEVRLATSDKRGVNSLVTVRGLQRKTAVRPELNNQFSREKLGRDTADCPVLSAGQLYSYTCGWSNILNVHAPLKPNEYSSQIERPIPGIVEAVPYLDGLLALRLTGDALTIPTLSFIKNGQIVSNLIIPSQLTNEASGATYKLLVDRENTDRFIVMAKTSSLALAVYTNLSSVPKVETYTYKGVELKNSVVAADIYKGNLILAIGQSAEVQNGRVETSKKKVAKKEVIIRQFDVTNLSNIVKEYGVEGVLNQVRLCGKTAICILQDNQLKLYEAEVSRLLLRGVINDVSGVAMNGENDLMYWQGNSVFVLNQGELVAKQIFQVDSGNNTSITSLTQSGGAVLVNTSSDNAAKRQVVSTFKLGAGSAKNNRFLDQYLPYTNIQGVWDTDFQGQTIVVTLLLTSAFLDRSTGRLSYDQAEYNRVTKTFTDRLRADGFKPDEYSITYIVSY